MNIASFHTHLHYYGTKFTMPLINSAPTMPAPSGTNEIPPPLPRAGDQFAAVQDAITSMAPLQEVMMRYVEYVLSRHENNKCHAARTLGINRRTIQRWLKGDPPDSKAGRNRMVG